MLMVLQWIHWEVHHGIFLKYKKDKKNSPLSAAEKYKREKEKWNGAINLEFDESVCFHDFGTHLNHGTGAQC